MTNPKELDPAECDNPQDPVRLPILPEDIGKRIDRFLSEKLEQFSRTRIQYLIQQGRVQVGEKVVRRNNFKIRETGELFLHPPLPVESDIRPENLPISILYEDEDLAVVEKPAGMPTHPTTFKTSGTLVNALLWRLDGLSEIGGVLRPGIVHRLDRVTSGLLVVAKNQVAHESLSNQFKNRTIRKTYRALCLGKDPGPAGLIQGKIERHPHRRHRMLLGSRGRESATEFRQLQSNPPLHGLLVYPHTGRTHQIRVHMESLGCPVVLDKTYGYEPSRWPLPELNPLLRDYPGIFLHAEEIEFEHPIRKERLRFRTLPPRSFRKVWDYVFKESLD